VIAKCEPLEAVHGKTMREIHAEALTIDDFFGGFFLLWFRFVLLLWTFGEDVLMAAFMDNTRAH
jgi:hypothetical protein